MTTTPPQPPQNPYPAQPAGYGPPQEQFPQYAAQPGTIPPSQQASGQQQPNQHGMGQPMSAQPGTMPPGQPMPGQQHGYQGPPAHQAPSGQPPAGHGQFEQGPFVQGQGPVGQGPTGQGHVGQGQEFGQPQSQQMSMGAMQCRFCGSVPAIQATVRGHMGLLIVMRFLRLEGPFCRTCGVATVRDMTAKSMWQGWWGIGSAIINPFTMLSNIGPWKKFNELPEPAPGAPGRPMEPGKPLFKRPAVLGLLVPIVVIAVIVITNLTTTTSSEAKAGDCVMNAGTSSDPDVKVVDCSSADAEFKVLGRVSSSVSSTCDLYEEATVTYTEKRGSTGYTLCLGPK